MGLLILMQVARCVQTTQNRKSVIFLLRVLQLLLCSIVMQRIQIFYRGPAIFIVTCFLAQPDCTNVLPKHWNTMIKHQLCWEGFPSLFSLLQVDVFPEKQTILQQIILYPSNKPKKSLYQVLWYKQFHPKSYKKVLPYCNWKSISSMWCEH